MSRPVDRRGGSGWSRFEPARVVDTLLVRSRELLPQTGAARVAGTTNGSIGCQASRALLLGRPPAERVAAVQPDSSTAPGAWRSVWATGEEVTTTSCRTTAPGLPTPTAVTGRRKPASATEQQRFTRCDYRARRRREANIGKYRTIFDLGRQSSNKGAHAERTSRRTGAPSTREPQVSRTRSRS